ncbi:MAG: hypothetical protein RBU30_25545, partial [Polyangia bacterium]|nr:hypothetical protein [Polyangia bacterium]
MSTEPGFVETKKYCADSLPLGALRRYLSSTLARGLAVVPVAIALGAIITAGCESHPGGGEPDALVAPDAQGPDGQAQPDGGTPDAEAPGPDVWTAPSCEFTYEEEFVYPSPAPAPGNAQSGDLHGQTAPAGETSPRPSAILGAKDGAGVGVVAHQEPLPETYWLARSAGHGLRKDAGDIVMPGYTDNMPLFARAAAWDTATRCYELPDVAVLLTEDEAFELYRRIGELTTGVTWNLTPGRRNVLGLRGAYPGSFRWHGNLVNRFNDTLVLLWIDELGVRHVREFPVNTDTGAHDFGVDSSSSLRPNRRYRYANGWHRTYNALHIAESDYQVRDDGNKNGHWDSDRNGWWPPTTGTDRDRTGGGHNIHMGS